MHNFHHNNNNSMTIHHRHHHDTQHKERGEDGIELCYLRNRAPLTAELLLLLFFANAITHSSALMCPPMHEPTNQLSYLCHFKCIFHSRIENKIGSHIQFFLLFVLPLCCIWARMHKYWMWYTHADICFAISTIPLQLANMSLVILLCFVFICSLVCLCVLLLFPYYCCCSSSLVFSCWKCENNEMHLFQAYFLMINIFIHP